MGIQFTTELHTSNSILSKEYVTNVILRIQLIILALRILSENVESMTNQPWRKDPSLKTLNDHILSLGDLFGKWSDTDKDYETFFKTLEPWIVGNFSHELKNVTRPKYELDCKNPDYSGVLTGNKLPNPRIIVDFVPFGYEVDKFFVRLYETSDYVDAFVVYESSRTQSGMHKPLYFMKLRSTHRLQPWLHKILHFVANDAELSELLRRTKTQVNIRRRHGTGVYNKDLWALEAAMRTKMLEKFINLDSASSPLKHRIMSNMKDALAIQNDGDEIIKGEVLYHLKHCEIKSEVVGIYTPSLYYKRNFHWLEKTLDLNCISKTQPSFPYLDKIDIFTSRLWRPGPYVYPLSLMIGLKHSNRKHVFENDFYCKHHMGIGSAIHISSISDPVELWLKRCGVIEQYCQNMFTDEFLSAIRKKNLTAHITFKNAFQPMCTSRLESMLYVPTVPYPERSIFELSVPWIVRQNPDSFPFMLPLNATESTVINETSLCLTAVEEIE